MRRADAFHDLRTFFAKHVMNEAGIEAVVTGRHGRMRREDEARTHRGEVRIAYRFGLPFVRARFDGRRDQ